MSRSEYSFSSSDGEIVSKRGSHWPFKSSISAFRGWPSSFIIITVFVAISLGAAGETSVGTHDDAKGEENCPTLLFQRKLERPAMAYGSDNVIAYACC